MVEKNFLCKYFELLHLQSGPKVTQPTKNIEYFPFESNKRADFLTSDTGIYKLYIHKDKSRETLY